MVGATLDVRRPVPTRTHTIQQDTGGAAPGPVLASLDRCLPACVPPTRSRCVRHSTRWPAGTRTGPG